MESIKEIVCRNCKRLLNRSVNLTEISRLMQVHPSTISRWKSGEHAPELDKIDKLAEILKVNPLEFYQVEAEVTQRASSVSATLKKLLTIPDDVYELADKLGSNNKIWEEEIIPLLEAAVEDEEIARQKKSQQA